MTKLQDWENRIQCGDAYETLKQMPSEIISCVMTSFPYWGQRDYKVKGQMGLEKHYQEWLEKAWAVMDEIWRVLRLDGTCWINLGDKYGTHTSKRSGQFGKEIKDGFDDVYMRNISVQGSEKSLLFIPERFAIGCLDRGWILRNKCIWQKPNPMPCSAKDRFTTTWEYLFFMTKSKKYWFDLDAVRRPHKMDFDKLVASGGASQKYDGEDKLLVCRERVRPHPAGKNPGDVITTRNEEIAEHFRQQGSGGHFDYGGLHSPEGKHQHPAGANPGDFWSIPTQPSKLPHYASYPEKLCLTPLKAGCPRWICKECGMARCRVTEKTYTKTRPGNESKYVDENGKDMRGDNSGHLKYRAISESHTLGWSFCSCLCPACGEADCKCGKKWRPGIVEDPFCGIGTTLIVAKKLGLWYHGIDLKQEYVDMSIKRLKDVKYQEVFAL